MPGTALVVDDDRLLALLAPDVVAERLGGDATWSEGPVWLPGQDVVLWSDVRQNRILAWDAATGAVTTHASDVEWTNGRTLDLDGHVVECSHGRRAVQRVADGRSEVLVDRWDGVRLNSPNDVVVKSDGTIWFTDPAYGITQEEEGRLGEREYGHHAVFRLDPATGRLDAVVLDVEEPNGLAFSPDESLLYVSDTAGPSGQWGSGNHHLRVYDVRGGRFPKNGRVFAVVEPGVPDGFRVDVAGNVWSSAEDGVHVFAADGTRLGVVPVPETVSNLCFGGPGFDTLFVTATSGLYRVPTLTRGARPTDLLPASSPAGS